MKRKLMLALTVSLGMLVPKPGYALFGVGDIVYDPAAVAQLIEQVQQTVEVINRLQDLSKWAELDHVNLAGKKFHRFLTEYTQLFDEVMDKIDSYQDGGLMGQLERLDEVYWSYYNDWDRDEVMKEANEGDPLHAKLAKEVLWTRIQFKHAAKVGAQIRESLPKTQAQIGVLLDDTAQAVGIMQSIKIGNQLTGMVAKSLQTLNVSFTEQLQAQAGQGLEQNQKQGLKLNRAREAIKDWGKFEENRPLAPLNPFENF